MILKKTIAEQKKERNLLIILFFIALFLSNLGVPVIADSAIMPNYFIALIITFILQKLGNLNLYKLVIIGLLVDILVGQLLGQYAFIFIGIYLANHIINKVLSIKSEKQVFTLSFFLTLISFFILWVSSLSHSIFISPKIILFQIILTFIATLIFSIFIKRFILR
jgi:rod shape-determining protein MreD